MEVLVTKILEVAKQTGKPRPAGKGTVTLVAPDEAAGGAAAKSENAFANLTSNLRLDQCCKT